MADQFVMCSIHKCKMAECFLAHNPEAYVDGSLGAVELEELQSELHEGLQDGSLVRRKDGEIVPSEPEIIVLEVPVIRDGPHEVTPGHGTRCACSQCCAGGWAAQQMGEL